MPAATKLLERAARLVPEDGGERSELELALGWALTQSGEFGAAEAIFDAIVARSAARGDRRVELRGLVERMDVVNLLRPEGASTETLRLSEAIVPELEALGDDRGLARAWRVAAHAHSTLGRAGATVDALERALAHAERADDPALRSELLGWLPTRFVRGPVPADAALERCRELLAQAAGDLPAEAGALAGIALLESIRGRFDEARAAESRSRAIKEELGLPFNLAVGSIWRGEIELLAGDLAGAESAFRAAIDFLGERGELGFYAFAVAGLARVLFLQQRYDESRAALATAEGATATDDSINLVWMLGTRARLLAADGSLDEARAAAERGVELAYDTDDLSLQADSLIELAEVVGDATRAQAALEDAVRVAERKGNVVLARHARDRLAR
jgi:tetratricopeptide (TPR) repeat protein